MYIKKIEINNIRSISGFTMDFPEGEEAGWHVLIGDNATGKSTIVRSIAAALIGPEEIGQVRPYWEEWLSHNEQEGSIKLDLIFDKKLDKIGQTRPPKNELFTNELRLKRNGRVHLSTNFDAKTGSPKKFNWGSNNTKFSGWFSVAYGPFRRFTGGNPEWNKVYYSAPKAGAHLSVFGEDIALTEALDYLKELDRRRIKEKDSPRLSGVAEGSVEYQTDSDWQFEGIRRFINQSNLLPHQASFVGINLDGEPEFKDGNGNIIKITQLSDGYRSILSMTFELIRQLVHHYGANAVFPKEQEGGLPIINLPGVVLIDEIDAHLHPTWQTRIGQWFTQYFPGLQFIVTTHSPLICRASEKGSIWRLPLPGSGDNATKVLDTERNRLIYGNVLDAYGTGIFGSAIAISQEGNEKRGILAKLSIKSITGTLSKKEEEEYVELLKIFPSKA